MIISWWPDRCNIKIILAGYQNKQTQQITRCAHTSEAEKFDAGDEVKENNSIRMDITVDTIVSGLCTTLNLTIASAQFSSDASTWKCI